jgi:methylated-DNA-[protein]-cysteine S-methyltransferase
MKSGTITSPFGPLSFTVEASFVTGLQYTPGNGTFDGWELRMEETVRQLREYVTAIRFSFNLPLTPAISEFQSQVRRVLIAIPYDEMPTYRELAKKLSSAPQAVSPACGANPVPIIVPCYQVFASSGKLGGFTGSGGVSIKKKLLDHEAVYAPLKLAKI